MKINNRRKNSTYLDYQYGQVVSMDEENGVQQEKSPAIEEVEVKGKTIKLKPVYVVFSLLFGFIVCLIVFLNSYNSIALTGKTFAFLNSSFISATSYEKDYAANKKTEQMQNNGSNINILDFEGQKEYKKAKENASNLMKQISGYDSYFKGYYDTLKREVQTYRNNKSSYYIMNSSIKNLNKTVTYDYNNLLSSNFVDKEVKMLFVSRYKILISFLSEHENNFTKTSLLTDVNNLIIEDNNLNLQEYELLKQYLKEHGISYVCENNKIRIT